jgi:hypothetical protein
MDGTMAMKMTRMTVSLLDLYVSMFIAGIKKKMRKMNENVRQPQNLSTGYQAEVRRSGEILRVLQIQCLKLNAKMLLFLVAPVVALLMIGVLEFRH